MVGAKKEFNSQFESNKHFSKTVKGAMDKFNTSQKWHVEHALGKMAFKEVGKMQARLRRHGGRGKKVAPEVDWSTESNTGLKGRYATYKIGVFEPVFGEGRGSVMDFAALLHTGAKQGKPMSLTNLAVKQGRTFNYFGNWPGTKKTLKFTVAEGYVSPAIPSMEPDFLEKGEKNIIRDIKREIPKAMKEAAKVIGYYARKQR